MSAREKTSRPEKGRILHVFCPLRPGGGGGAMTKTRQKYQELSLTLNLAPPLLNDP